MKVDQQFTRQLRNDAKGMSSLCGKILFWSDLPKHNDSTKADEVSRDIKIYGRSREHHLYYSIYNSLQQSQLKIRHKA